MRLCRPSEKKSLHGPSHAFQGESGNETTGVLAYHLPQLCFQALSDVNKKNWTGSDEKLGLGLGERLHL